MFKFTRSKKIIFALLLTVAVASAGCYGKFALTRKVYELNGQITDNKFVHSLVMIGFYIVPIYGLAALGDVLIFNVIEFWAGENPVAEQTGDHQVAIYHDGKTYTIVALGNDSYSLSIDGQLAAVASRDAAGTLSVRNLAGEKLGSANASTMEQASMALANRRF